MLQRRRLFTRGWRQWRWPNVYVHGQKGPEGTHKHKQNPHQDAHLFCGRGWVCLAQ